MARQPYSALTVAPRRRWLPKGSLFRTNPLSPFAGLALILLLGGQTTHGTSVVINELMYNPPNGRDDLQFIELHNIAETSVDLSGWRFTKGVQATLPEGTTLPAKGFGILCRNEASFESHYGTDIPILGVFEGKLSSGGETLRLEDSNNVPIEAFEYDDRAPWPTSPDGVSASLERISPIGDARDYANWGASNVPSLRRAAGTPGKQNERFTPTAPPVVESLELIQEGDDIVATTRLRDGVSIKSVALHQTVAWTGNEGSPQPLSMRRLSETTFHVRFSPKEKQGLLRCHVIAQKTNGATRRFPSAESTAPEVSRVLLPPEKPQSIRTIHLVNVEPFKAPTYRYGIRVRGGPESAPSRGRSAAVVTDQEGNRDLHDFVRIATRSAGFKVRFRKGHEDQGMRTINLIRERSDRQVFAEHLAFEFYRRANVLAPHSEIVRLVVDGSPVGYALLVEQLNESFFRRHEKNANGHLYKSVWYGRNTIDRHEKKTRPLDGHHDILEAVQGLQIKDPTLQWQYIETHFDFDAFAAYYAAAHCLSNWDGFFNNHFLYHDVSEGGKWAIIPWDNDKTWGDYDGAPQDYSWYKMPLTFGMNGDRPPSTSIRQRFFSRRMSPFGSVNWWRPPGEFSGPLLANPTFRKRFLAHLKLLCEGPFSSASFGPVVDQLELALTPTIEWDAQVRQQNTEQAKILFRSYLQSFRDQLDKRRAFLIHELKKHGY